MFKIAQIHNFDLSEKTIHQNQEYCYIQL